MHIILKLLNATVFYHHLIFEITYLRVCNLKTLFIIHNAVYFITMSQQISNPLALLGIIKNRLVESVIGRRNKQALEYRNKVGYCMSYGTT